MKNVFLTAVSAIALIAASPSAHSSEDRAPATQPQTTVEKAWDDTKEGVSQAADTVSETAKEAYEDVKHALKDSDDNADLQKITVAANHTANGMIGQPVYNTKGERVAKIHDIILNGSGDAEWVILADGDFTGMGKLVAFDYDIVTSRSTNGDIITSLTEDVMDKAANFSYDPDEGGDQVRTLAADGYSVNQLLEGSIVDPKGESLADVDNIVFRNGKADQVIVSFGKMLGMGGEQAAIAYSDADIKRDKDDHMKFALSANETTQFKKFQKTEMK